MVGQSNSLTSTKCTPFLFLRRVEGHETFPHLHDPKSHGSHPCSTGQIKQKSSARLKEQSKHSLINDEK